MEEWVRALGKSVSDGLRGVGQVAMLFFKCLALLPRGLPAKRETIQQLYFVGVQSVPVILTTGAFVGAVLAYSFFNQFLPLGVDSWTGAVVAKAQVWQLGPVLVGLMLAGRVGCSMTAEIGSMNVTEQLDALNTMGTDPVRYLVLPRVTACFIMTPVLTVFSMLIGILAGLFMTVFILGAEFYYQWSQIDDWMVPYDYVQGISKALVFGVAISLICCRSGMRTTGGAAGVGQATTSANVSSCITILILNLVMSIILFYAQPLWDAVANSIDSLIGYIRAFA